MSAPAPHDFDAEGFLWDRNQWDPSLAAHIATREGIHLSDDHWEVLTLVREYYEAHRLFPPNRVLVSKMRDAYGPQKGSSIHLMQLFTGKPAKLIAEIAGLPKPPNCD